ncbi:MAG: 8-oxo-dGTP diphosphatase [Lactobacillales bacterium]|jgi:8-oxo-dGTP diphosphatase|nr:8-oxo-dGTP diphosphatase [Lactobacillales bacterium]
MDMLRTTLCIITDPKTKKTLLIRHKRGPGDGFYNFPGGKLEQTETPVETCIRETREETGITPVNPEIIGLLEFFWPDKKKHVYNYVFMAQSFSGHLKNEGDEVKPLWRTRVPLSKMWPADWRWIKKMRTGNPFHFEITNPKDPQPICAEKPITFEILKNLIRTKAR